MFNRFSIEDNASGRLRLSDSNPALQMHIYEGFVYWRMDSGFGVEGCDVHSFMHLVADFLWSGCDGFSAENECSKGESDIPDKSCSRKRLREDACSGAGNKACREKMRRDRLNDRFLELSAVLEPGRPPKTDKATILSDAVRILGQLRSEAQQLQDSNNQLRDAIKELKTEKNELRDEKSRLKAEKERLEQQVKAMTIPTGYMPHPAAVHAAAAAFAAQSQAASNKAAQMAGYPGMAMWQWMPPAAVDTSQDHVLRPPVA